MSRGGTVFGAMSRYNRQGISSLATATLLGGLVHCANTTLVELSSTFYLKPANEESGEGEVASRKSYNRLTNSRLRNFIYSDYNRPNIPTLLIKFNEPVSLYFGG